MAALIILFLSSLATGARIYFGTPQTQNLDIQFFATVINTLSIFWLAFILGRNERKDHATFGEAVRREMATVVLAITLSASYTLVALFHMLSGAAASGS